MPAHVFVDNSNVFGGAQRTADRLEPGIPWPAVRVYYRNLYRLLEGGREVLTRVMAGSVPPGNDDLWEYSRQAGYDADLLYKVTAKGRVQEQGVDELLHLKMANATLDFAAPEMMIVATGDGAMSHYGTSFLGQIDRALQRGWDIEIWSWEDGCSKRLKEFALANKTRVALNILDSYYPRITFIQEGEYEIGESGATVSLKGRIVRPLT